MLTYNAPRYVLKSITEIKKTKGIDYELIVVDNNSGRKTKFLLRLLQLFGFIDKLHFNKENALFAKGNNIASKFASDDVTHYCLINSDISIKDPLWLSLLTSLYPQSGGICAYGVCLDEPVRADGYCMLIDRGLYDKYQLDEDFQWWWSITKLQSEILQEGYQIVAVKNHEKVLHHFGGASGKGYINAKGMDINIDEVKKWFALKKSEVILIDSL